MKKTIAFVLVMVFAVGAAQDKFITVRPAPSAGAPVNIVTPGPDIIQTFIVQDFEGATFPPTGWTSQSTGSGRWLRSTSASGYGNGAGSALADFFNISAGQQISLITPLLTATSPADSLRFDHAYATYATQNDQLQISTSTDGGGTWSVLITLDGGASGPLVTAPPTSGLFVPTASQWATKKYALPAGTTRVKFTGISAFGNDLYVDNIAIGAVVADDVGMVSFDAPRTNLAPGTYTPQVTIRNYGLNPVSFPVTMKITPGGYSSTQNITALAPSTTQQITFANWTPGVGGYTLTATSALASDSNRTNDTISSFTIVSNINRAVLLEYCTGTWCPWCPCGDITAGALLAAHPDLVVLAYHGGYTSEPYYYFNGNNVLNLLSFNAFPTALLDRQNTPDDYTTWTGFCTNRYTNYAPTPVTIAVRSNSYDTTSRTLTVRLGLTTNCDLPAQYKLNYVMSEGNLIYSQAGNATCTGGTTWVHNWVVRNMVNGPTGQNVNTGIWRAGTTIAETLTTTIDPAWVAANCNLAIFVYKDNAQLNRGEVQNAIVIPLGRVTGVGLSGTKETPGSFELAQNYPNPFNPTTNVRFTVPKAGFVSLKVYDVTGREVLTGVNEVLQPGSYNVQIDASNLSSGVYFYKLAANGFSATKKMTVVK